MLSLSQIESDLQAAMKAKAIFAVDALRGLKTRATNEKIAKQKELTLDDLLGLVRSEIKKRKEAAEAFQKGNRAEQAQKELAEISVLEKYLPAQVPEAEIIKQVDELLAQNQFTAKDFGKAMTALKAQLGSSADGSLLAKLLKEKLK